MLEKQKEREEFEQTLQGWEDELLEQPIKDYMRTMWEVRIISKSFYWFSFNTNRNDCICLLKRNLVVEIT